MEIGLIIGVKFVYIVLADEADTAERRRGTTNSYQLLFNSHFQYRSGIGSWR